MKKLTIFLLLLCIGVSCLSFSSSALSVSSTYSDVASTSSQAVNLVNYALSYDSFINSDYVVFCDVQNSYYIVWGDLNYNGSAVTGNSVEFIHYYRTGTTGNNTYTYSYGTDNSFSLRASNVCTSNISGFGFVSSVYTEHKNYYNYSLFLVFLGSIMFVILIQHLRKGSAHV